MISQVTIIKKQIEFPETLEKKFTQNTRNTQRILLRIEKFTIIMAGANDYNFQTITNLAHFKLHKFDKKITVKSLFFIFHRHKCEWICLN